MTDQNFLETLKTKSSSNKNIIIGVAVLIVVLFIGVFFIYKNKIEQKQEGEKQEPKNIVTPQVVRTSKNILQKELPAGFPKDIPLNGKKELIDGYLLNYQNEDNNQKVIDFVSLESLKENYEFYLNWAEKNGWRVMHKTIDSNNARLILEKDKKYLNVIIQKDSQNEKISKINMSF